MPISLSIRNFRNLESVDLEDTGKISVVLGDNESGKSSLAGAIEFALTGSAYGLKGKDISHLIRRDQTRMKTQVRCGSLDVSRTPTSGPTIRDVADRFGLDVAALPLILNPSFCSGGKALSAFLALQESTPLDIQSLFSDSPAILPFLNEVAAAAKDQSPRATVASAESLRAGCKQIGKPEAPAVSRESAAENIAKLNSWVPLVSEAETLRGQINQLAEVISHLQKVADYKPAANDPLKARRAPLQSCLSLTIDSFERTAATLEAAGFKDAAAKVRSGAGEVTKAVKAATEELAKNPTPKAAAPLPVMNENLRVFLESLNDPSLTGTGALAAVTSRHASLSQKVETLLAEVHTSVRDSGSLSAALARQNAVSLLWDSYESAIKTYEADAAAIEERWTAFDTIAKRIAKELQDRRSRAGSEFLAKVTAYAAPILNGRGLTLSSDNEVLLDGLSVDLLSGSTKWRLLSAVMAAIAKSAGSPLLILDGMDILSPKNRTETMRFIMDSLSSDFEHIILTSTFRGNANDLEPFTTPGITKWILSDGHIRDVRSR